ncbi:MAG: gluconolactonase [Pirellulaceae bacterium]|nr:MAG: gluconolactonase [Pirellulaceae bacterium]
MKRLLCVGVVVSGVLCVGTVLLSAADPIKGIGPAGEIRKLHSGLQFTEGPAWDGHGALYFSDIPANRIYRLDSAGQLEVFLEPSNHTNGLMVNKAGNIVACEMDGRLVEINVKTKDVKVLAAGYQGKRFNAPNDLVLDKHGGVYFTDPHFRAPMPLPQEKTCVYYCDAHGNVTRLIEDLKAPNGILLSPDEKTLYVLPSLQKEMMAYAVEGPGKLGAGRVFFSLVQPEGRDNLGGDGGTVDSQGNVYITSALGIQVVSPQGQLLGIIELPEQPANCTFGGPDMKTLYVTARTSLYAVPMEVAGHRYGQ